MSARLRTLAALALVASIGLGAGECWRPDAGDYRGGPGAILAATGRFRVEQVDGVWWLVTPDGHLFFSAGVNHVSSWADHEPDTGRYPYRESVLARWGSEQAWADAVVERLGAAGLNTIGAWSQLEHFRGRFPYTQVMGFSGAAPVVVGASPVRDFFAPAFESGAAAHAEGARACADDPFCIGVFSDNELMWGPGTTQSIPFVEAYLMLPGGAPGRLALQGFFEARYQGDVAAFEAVWELGVASWDDLQTVASPGMNYQLDAERQADRAAFRGQLAERYYRVVHDALRAVSPDVLILGSRFLAYSISEDVALAAAPWLDVFSANPYEWNDAWSYVARQLAILSGQIVADALLDDVDRLHELTGKPVMITEFGYRAADVGLPNSHPPVYPVLPDQRARADAYARYMGLVLARPYLVGAHWFEYADQPFHGRFDGEDNNWGLVSLEDEVYPDLSLRMWSVGSRTIDERLALAE